MSFQDYDEFKDAVSSEKISLIFIYPRRQVTTFTNDSGNVWYKDVDAVISNLYNGSTLLAAQTSNSVDVSNPWFFDITSNRLWYYTTSTIPDDDNIIAEFKLFYSNAPINLSYDLQDDSEQVEYEPRILKTVGFKSQIGSDQKGISITGSGTVSLQNNDGYFDSIFDKYIWENKKVEIYSYNRDLAPSEATIQYKGFIVNKSFNSDTVKFKIQDAIFKLDTLVSMNLFKLSDGVGPQFVGQVKRHVYGKVEGLLCRSIDQVGDGYTLTGTVSGTSATTSITGSGTSFLTELAMNDIIIIDGFDYTVETISSDTALVISDTDGLSSSFTAVSMKSNPSVPNPEFNREFFVADHAIKQGSSTITAMTQLNRLSVADIDGYEIGDSLGILGDTHTIFAISGNQIQLTLNATTLYPIGAVVLKQPITEIFANEKTVLLSDLAATTNTTTCRFTLTNTAEFNITPDLLVNDANFTFTSGSDIVAYTGTVDLLNTFRERDWIKKEGDLSTTYMRIVHISGTSIKCASSWAGTTGSSKKAVKRRPNYIDDASSVSINCSGKTKNGDSTGDLVRTGADIVEDLLIGAGLSNDIDTASFDEASIANSMRMSITIPYSITSKSPKIKDIVNDINQSVFGNLSLKQDLTLAYNIGNTDRLDSISVINDDDIISWKFSGKETKSYKKVVSSYNFKDYDTRTSKEGDSKIEVSSDKVSDFDISNKEVYLNLRVLEEANAQELSERFLHNNEQTLTEIDVISDLRLSGYEIGDKVILNFSRLAKQISIDDNLRVFTVIVIKKDFNRIDLKLSDLGDLFNRNAITTDESVIDYATSTSDEKRFSSYMTDENDLVTGYDETSGKNLIS